MRVSPGHEEPDPPIHLFSLYRVDDDTLVHVSSKLIFNETTYRIEYAEPGAAPSVCRGAICCGEIGGGGQFRLIPMEG